MWPTLPRPSTKIAAEASASTVGPLRARVATDAGGPDLDQGAYVVQKLDSYAHRYWRRVAGEDGGLPPHTNGHDEFASQWTRDILTDLRGLPVVVFIQPFPTLGFHGLPAKHLGANVIVAVPGSTTPAEAVVVGAHYDGEPFSRGSAFDDTSGSVMTLGSARSLGAFWRAHGMPARTVEFVLFDAEEQGLIGSSAYLFNYRHHALLPKVVMMIDEEQSGVGYPVRPFGRRSLAPLPSYAVTTSPISGVLARLLGPADPPNKPALARMVRRLDTARTTVFPALRGRYGALPYRGGAAPAFASNDESALAVGPSRICCSDNAPFEALGLPTATFVGDSSYYDRAPPAWAYPFDQPQDTPRALACDTGGAPHPSRALQAALALPVALSVVLVDDYAPAAGRGGIALLSDPLGAGAPIRFAATVGAQATWNFGDGGHAAGANVQHRYAHSGTYRLTVHGGSVTQTWSIDVPGQQASFRPRPRAIDPPRVRLWHPPQLAHVSGCH